MDKVQYSLSVFICLGDLKHVWQELHGFVDGCMFLFEGLDIQNTVSQASGEVQCFVVAAVVVLLILLHFSSFRILFLTFVLFLDP